jgi:hypothetical protein
MSDPELITEHVLYGGDVILRFDPERHRYTANGTPVESVTTFLNMVNKPALIPWAVKQTVEFLAREWEPGRAYTRAERDALLEAGREARFSTNKEACDIGTAAHAWIEAHIRRRIAGDTTTAPLPDDPYVAASVSGFLKWEREHNVTYLAAERRVYSRRYGYAGTLDCLAIVDGILTLLDFKTGTSGIWETYVLQMGAYAQAHYEETGERVGVAIILRIPKDGKKIETREVRNLGETFTAFRACLDLRRWSVINQVDADAQAAAQGIRRWKGKRKKAA